MGIIADFKKYIKRSKERSKAKKVEQGAKTLAKIKKAALEGVHEHRGNLTDRGLGVELDRTRTLSHEWDGQNLAVWHEGNKGKRDYIKDDAFLKNDKGLITMWGAGITSEKTDLNMLEEVLQERMRIAFDKNFTIDSIMDVETALDSFEFQVEQSKDSLSRDDFKAAKELIENVRFGVNEKKSKRLDAILKQKLKKARDQQFTGDTLPELERALGTFELHIDESKNTQSEESYKDAKKRIEALKKDIRRIKMIKRTTPTVKRDVPKNGTKSNKPKELKGPVRKPRPKGRSLGRS